LISELYFVFQFAREKACELEDYQCISLSGTDLDGDAEPAVKKRKLMKQVKYSVFCEPLL